MSCLVASWLAVDANAQDEQPVALSDVVGVEIDADERRAYALFPDVTHFVSAQFVKVSATQYRIDYVYLRNGESKQESRSVDESAWLDTRTHVGLVEQYQDLRNAQPTGEDAWQYGIALRYAARARYDIAKTLIDDFLAEYPASPLRQKAVGIRADIHRLDGSKGAYFRGEALAYDKSGRANLLLFAGYYGIWAAIATPAAFEADNPQAYAGALLAIPAASVYLAHRASKNTHMGKGRAGIISLGGNLGTWQGLGWASLADNADGSQVVGVALVSGLVGVVAGSFLTSRVHFSEGHGLLTEAAMLWGGWFGLVTGGIANGDDDSILRASLVGTNALVLGTGFAARNVKMSENRVRLINLSGIVGTLAAGGVLLLFETDDATAVWGGLGVGSVGGLALGFRLTRHFDKDPSRYSRGGGSSGRVADANPVPVTLRPVLGVGRDPLEPRQLMTRLGIQVGF